MTVHIRTKARFLFGTHILKFICADCARFEVSSKDHGSKRRDTKCSDEVGCRLYELLDLNSLLFVRNILVLATLATAVRHAKLDCCSVFANRYLWVVMDVRSRMLGQSFLVHRLMCFAGPKANVGTEMRILLSHPSIKDCGSKKFPVLPASFVLV